MSKKNVNLVKTRLTFFFNIKLVSNKFDIKNESGSILYLSLFLILPPLFDSIMFSYGRIKQWLTCIFDGECIMLNIFIFDIIWHEDPKGLSVILYQKWIYLAWCSNRQKYKVNQCYCCSISKANSYRGSNHNEEGI